MEGKMETGGLHVNIKFRGYDLLTGEYLGMEICIATIITILSKLEFRLGGLESVGCRSCFH